MFLTEFATFVNFDASLDFLSKRLALIEPWDYSDPEKEYYEGNNAAEFYLPILRNYILHTFGKIASEKKIAYTDDKNYACFNTGLVTPNLEDIFAFFEKTKLHNAIQPYFFKAFIKKSSFDYLTHFSKHAPEAADYFSHPELLLFNPKLQLIPDIDHIIRDNKHRFPGILKTAPDREVRKHLIGAIDDISKLVKINYKIAIPQYYDEKFQLLLPLYLEDQRSPDLALVVEKVNDKTYSARTCLTIGMAYNNARLIVCPHSEWLQP